jgi:hypothetical protein
MQNDDETFFDAQGQEFYKDTNEPVWPHRIRERPKTDGAVERPLVEDTYVSYLLGRLDGLEKQTRPSGGMGTSKAKDMAAFDALELAGELVASVAGWAIDHQIGLAAKGLQFVPLQPSGTKDHPEYLEGRMRVDSHEHEKAGARETGDKHDPEFLRKCLMNLLLLNPGGWPAWLCQQTSDAIERLEYGEIPPIFDPVKEGRKRNLPMRKLERDAVAMVTFRRHAYKMTKEEALSEVAGALGVSPDTVKSWEWRLRGASGFGKLEVDRYLSFAKNHASFVKDAREKERLGQPFEDVSVHESEYGAAALEKLGKTYITLLGAQ